MIQPPSASTLSAFGLSPTTTTQLSPLDGGQGFCYIYRPSEESSTWTVLRPSDDPAEIDFLAELSIKLLNPPSQHYRVARPIPLSNIPESSASGASEYVTSDNWTAQSYVSGSAGPKGHWKELFAVSHAFHTDLARACPHKPSFFLDDPSKTNRWREADWVVWNEKPLTAVANVNQEMLSFFQSTLERLDHLQALLQQPEPDWRPQYQLIHGDLTGNVLFETSAVGSDRPPSPPAIIDLTPYWRPARYADAIIIADGLLWHDEGLDLLRQYDRVDDEFLHLLIKALCWRCVTCAIDPDVDWVKAHLRLLDRERAVDAVEKAVAELRQK